MNKQMSAGELASASYEEYKSLEAQALDLKTEIAKWSDQSVLWQIVRPSIALGSALSKFADGMKLNADLVRSQQTSIVTPYELLRTPLAAALARFHEDTRAFTLPQAVTDTLGKIEDVFTSVPSYASEVSASHFVPAEDEGFADDLRLGRAAFQAPIGESLAEMLATLAKRARRDTPPAAPAPVPAEDHLFEESKRMPEIPGMIDALTRTSTPVHDVYQTMTAAITPARAIMDAIKLDTWAEHASFAESLEADFTAAQGTLPLPTDEIQAADHLIDNATNLAETYSALVGEVKVILEGKRSVKDGTYTFVTKEKESPRTYTFTREQLNELQTAAETLGAGVIDFTNVKKNAYLQSYGVETLKTYLLDESLQDAAAAKGAATGLAIDPDAVTQAWDNLNLNQADMVSLSRSFLAIGKYTDAATRNDMAVASFDAFMDAAGNQGRIAWLTREQQTTIDAINSKQDIADYLSANSKTLTMGQLLNLGDHIHENLLLDSETPEPVFAPAAATAPEADAPVVYRDFGPNNAAIAAGLTAAPRSEESVANEREAAIAEALGVRLGATPAPAENLLEQDLGEPQAYVPLPEKAAAKDVTQAGSYLADSLEDFAAKSKVMFGHMTGKKAEKLANDFANDLTITDSIVASVSAPYIQPDDLTLFAGHRAATYNDVQEYLGPIQSEAALRARKERDTLKKNIWTNVATSYDAVLDDMYTYFQLQGQNNTAFSAQVEALRPSLTESMLAVAGPKFPAAAATPVIDIVVGQIYGHQNGVEIAYALDLAQQAEKIKLDAEGKPRKEKRALLAKLTPEMVDAHQSRAALLRYAEEAQYFHDVKSNPVKYARAHEKEYAAFARLAQIGAPAVVPVLKNILQLEPEEITQATMPRVLRGLRNRLNPADGSPRIRREPGFDPRGTLVLTDADRLEPTLGRDLPAFLRPATTAAAVIPPVKPAIDNLADFGPTIEQLTKLDAIEGGNNDAAGKPVLPAAASTDDALLDSVDTDLGIPLGAPHHDDPDAAFPPLNISMRDQGFGPAPVEKGSRIGKIRAGIILGANKTGAFAVAAAKQLWNRRAIVAVGSTVRIGARYGLGLAAGLGVGVVGGAGLTLAAPVVAAAVIVASGVSIVGGAYAGAFTARLNTTFDQYSKQGQGGLKATGSALYHTMMDVKTGSLMREASQGVWNLPGLLNKSYKAVRARDNDADKSILRRGWNSLSGRVRMFAEAGRTNPDELRMGLGTLLGGAGSALSFMLITSHMEHLADTGTHPVVAPAPESHSESIIVNRAGKGDLGGNTATAPIPPVLQSPIPADGTNTVLQSPLPTDGTGTVLQSPIPAPGQQGIIPPAGPLADPLAPRIVHTVPVRPDAPVAPIVTDTIAAAVTDADKVKALMQLPEMRTALDALSPAQHRHFATLIQGANNGNMTSLNDLIDNISEGGRFHGNAFTHIRGLRPDHAHAQALRQLIHDKFEGTTFQGRGVTRAMDLNNDHLAALQGKPSKVGSWVASHPRPKITRPLNITPTLNDAAAGKGVVTPTVPYSASVPAGSDPLGDLIDGLPKEDAIAAATPPVEDHNPITALVHGIKGIFEHKAAPGDTTGVVAAPASPRPTIEVTDLPPTHGAFTSEISKTLRARFTGMDQKQFETMLTGVDQKNPGAIRQLKSWSRSILAHETNLTDHEKDLLGQVRKMVTPAPARQYHA